MNRFNHVSSLSDAELIQALIQAVARERRERSAVLIHLAEFENRGLHLRLAYNSMFDYLTRGLGYSEYAAYKRIHTARTVQRFRVLVPLLETGDITMTAISILAPHLDDANHTSLIAMAQRKRKIDVERLVAALAPKPDKGDSIRHLGPQVVDAGGRATPRPAADAPGTPSPPTAAPADGTTPVSGPTPASGSAPAPGEYPRIKPLSPGRVHFSFTAGEALLLNIRRAKDLLYHKYPDGKLEDVLYESTEALLERKDPDRRIARRKARAARGPGGAGGDGGTGAKRAGRA